VGKAKAEALTTTTTKIMAPQSLHAKIWTILI